MSYATRTRAARASAIWLPPPAGPTGRFTACWSSPVPRCAAAAAPTTVGAKPRERSVTAELRPSSAVALGSRPRIPRITAAQRVLHHVEDGGQPLRILAGCQPGHQAVENQFQVALQDVAGNVVAHPMRLLLAAQPIGRRRRQFRGTLRPAAVELGVVAELSRDLQPGGQPVELVGRGEHVTHHLNEALAGRHVGHPLGVLACQREKQRVLVPEVVEDRTARQPNLLLQPAHRGLVVAVFGEAAASAVEDLTAASRQMVLADSWHVGAWVAWVSPI